MSEEKESKKIIVDQEACIGCGTCVGIAEDYFELGGENNKSMVKKQYDEKDKDIIEEAVASCPVDAIKLK